MKSFHHFRDRFTNRDILCVQISTYISIFESKRNAMPNQGKSCRERILFHFYRKLQIGKISDFSFDEVAR